MNICVIGAGFVGLVTSVFFAEMGHNVICIDKDETKINKINNGNPPFFEKDLEKKLRSSVKKNLEASSNLENAVRNSKYIFICVGTPSKNDGGIDLSYLENVSDALGAILQRLDKPRTIIIKSTVVPGTTRKVFINSIENKYKLKNGKDYFVSMNPEFLREGSAVSDMYNPDRIIVGADEDITQENVLALYSKISEIKKIRTSIETAEISKYCSNLFYATLISFSNEIASICQNIENTEIEKVFRSLYLDRRLLTNEKGKSAENIGATSYIWPGIGFGGSCFPKDLKALINFSESNDVKVPILKSVELTNNLQSELLISKFIEKFKPKVLGILGLSFKPDTDDIRESKSIEIINVVKRQNLKLLVFDPLVKKIPNLNENCFQNSALDVIQQCDALVIATNWSEFKKVEIFEAINQKKCPLLDCRLSMIDYKNDLLGEYFGPGIPF